MDYFYYLVNIKKVTVGGGNRQVTFSDFWTLKIFPKIENTPIKWSRLENNFHITPRFGSVINYIPDKNILYLHAGQNFLMNEHYADLYKIKINIEKKEIAEKSKNEKITKKLIQI